VFIKRQKPSISDFSRVFLLTCTGLEPVTPTLSKWDGHFSLICYTWVSPSVYVGSSARIPFYFHLKRLLMFIFYIKFTSIIHQASLMGIRSVIKKWLDKLKLTERDVLPRCSSLDDSQLWIDIWMRTEAWQNHNPLPRDASD
jgi:hypothetical protein